MSSGSDNDNFESADDEPSCSRIRKQNNKSQRKTRKKEEEQKSDIVNNPDLDNIPGPSRQDAALPVAVPAAVVNQTKDDVSDDEWNDFDINDDALNIEQNNKTVKLNKDNDNDDDDGWEDDGFNDWDDNDDDIGQDNIPQVINIVDNAVVVPGSSKPTPSNTEPDFKELADKLSALGEKQSENNNAGGWGGWGGWGASLLTSSVSQITSHVSQGISTVANVLETGIGVPNPEEMARMQQRAEKEIESTSEVNPQTPDEENKKDEGFNAFKLDSLVSNMSKIVEKTAQSAVVVGGLDTLEEIGKRTMRVLQGEEDGKKRLSTLLREARERAEQAESTENSSELVVKNSPLFETLFDDFQGLVHLEALEMLSKQCDIKIQNLLQNSKGRELTDLKETLNQVKDICELNDDDENDEDNKVENLDAEGFKTKLTEATRDLGVTLNFNNIVNCWKEVCESCKETSDDAEKPKLTEEDMKNTASEGITKIAECSALSVQLLHRTTALLATRERRSTADEADGLTQLTNTLISCINAVSVQYTQKLTKMSKEVADSDKVNEMVTNTFLEAEKGCSYLKDAFILTIPIVQVGAT